MENVYDLLMRGDFDGDTSNQSRDYLPSGALGLVREGRVVEIAGKNFRVLGRESGGVALIGEFSIGYTIFGDNQDYIGSEVSSLCWDFYDTLGAHIDGVRSLIRRPIDLTALDGSGSRISNDMVVTAMTLDDYRKFRNCIDRESLPEGNIWLATAYSDIYSYDPAVLVITSNGMVDSLEADKTEAHVVPYMIMREETIVKELW